MAGTGQHCVFCEIVAGKEHAYRVFESEHALAILDIQPFAEGHCLVLSKRHVQFWHDLSEAESAGLFEAAHRVAARLRRALSPDFVCMYARGRRIPHTHIFLIPSYSGDLLDRFFNVLELVQESPDRLVAIKQREALEGTARLLREAD